jgi:hypothetical protein
MGQVDNTLRPFSQFVGQAIHTAKERQVRYQLPWERVRNLLSIRLEPLDTLLRVPRRPSGMIITDWPAGKEPDLTQIAFVRNRSVPVQIRAATPTDQGLLVRADPPLLASDRLLWCDIDCSLAQETAPLPPRQVTDLQERPLTVIDSPRADGDHHWVLLVQGNLRDCDLLVDGEEVEAEVVPAMESLRKVVDSAGASFDVTGGMLRVEEPPAKGPLRGDNGIRYRWEEAGSSGRRGNWVQLLAAPETVDAEAFLDPRAAFCEGDVEEVWTSRTRHKSDIYRVKKVDQDRYQLLLDRLPPEGTTLFLPVELRNLYLQKRALRQLSEAPLPHHQGLLRLCEDPEHARWPRVRPSMPAAWRSLTDETRSGTPEQRTFVAKALGSPDFAFLEGPPGSGKTTTICEIVQQLVDQGQRVLLCASTHVAIDNVLERLLESGSPIYAVRIGKADKVDDKVLDTQLDRRIEKLVDVWRGQPAMRKLGDGELEEMAQRTVIMAANLTCGTTMGIVNHPLFRGRDEDLEIRERPITTVPHWDVLIVDEASKTLIQEFMVPALMAKRWIIVGDVRQLPPFADRDDITANLRDLVDDDNRAVFPTDHQRACLLLFRLLRRQVRQAGMRWLIVEPPGVLSWIDRELETAPADGLSAVRIVARVGPPDGPIPLVTIAQVKGGAPEALRLASADWVLVSDDLLPEVSRFLPSNLLFARELSSSAGKPLPEGDPLLLRQAWWLAKVGRLERSYTEKKYRRDPITTLSDCQMCEADWLRRNDLAKELTWRITRLHELRHSYNDRERKRLWDDIETMKPAAVDITEALEEIRDIGLPSILEVLQEGIGEERSKRRSALTVGLRESNKDVFEARFESLSFQHRMHPEIAEFSRAIIYMGSSLKDANTIQSRDARLGWNFGPLPSRRAWARVHGREEGGENPDEVRVVAGLVLDFIAWARKAGPPRRDAPTKWEVACLCFYVKQERALSRMLQEITQDPEGKTRFMVQGAPVEIVCGTVDRFQGREADLVVLSMRNTRRVGFLDSPNRLNVAVTRARQQLVIVGNDEYFDGCGISELKELVQRTPRVSDPIIRQWRRRGP